MKLRDESLSMDGKDCLYLLRKCMTCIDKAVLNLFFMKQCHDFEHLIFYHKILQVR